MTNEELRKIKFEDLHPREQMWLKYEKVRRSGKYNMITDSDMARRAAKLRKRDYWFVRDRYGEIRDGLLAKLTIGDIEIDNLINELEEQ